MSSRAAAPSATTQRPASPPATSAPRSLSSPVVNSTSQVVASPLPITPAPVPTTVARPSTAGMPTSPVVPTSPSPPTTPTTTSRPPTTSTTSTTTPRLPSSTTALQSTIIIEPTSVASSKSSNTGVVVVGVAGGIAVLATIIIIFLFYRRRNRRREDFDGNFDLDRVVRHASAAVQRGVADVCLFCREMPTVEVRRKQIDFCSKRCSMAALSRVPMILEVPIGNARYMGVVDQFTKQWKHPTQKPTVIKLWRIYGDQSVFDRFSRYQLKVERRIGIKGGNTRGRFHGTIRGCTLGDTSSDDNLCMQTRCNMCRIIESSFQLARAGERTNFGRFGAGIYTSATSSKANDYYGGSASPNRAILLNDVVMGKAIKLRTTNQSLKRPPRGYDTVIGEPGGDLNYDECVVYNNAAIRPSFLIVYK